jgi:hypothetical protein
MMKSYKQYIKEETMPYAVTASGSISISDPAVLDGLNTLIAGVTSGKFVTPYIAFERVQKALANFLIFPPRPTFLEGDSGVYTNPISQFGDKMGQLENGDFVKGDGQDLHLFFEYRQSDCGMFNVFAEIVNQDELDEILDDLEDELNDDGEEDDELNEEKFTNRVPSANPYGNLDAASKEMNKPKPVPTRDTKDLDNRNRDAEGNTVVEGNKENKEKKNKVISGNKKNLRDIRAKMKDKVNRDFDPRQLKTMEEENLDEVSTETVGKVNVARMTKSSKTDAARKTLANRVKKEWLKSDVGKIKK